MKKIIAIVMALVMMMAIAVPSFAAVTGGSNAGSDTIINTLTTKEDGSDPTWYTVTIPAAQEIFWEATATEIEYTINSQLATGDLVKVTVADADNAYLMTKDGSNATLAYDIADKDYTATAEVVVRADLREYGLGIIESIREAGYTITSIETYEGVE